MAGPILSDSTPFLSSHERPTSYRNSPSSNSAYFPSTSAHQSYNHSSSSYYQHHQQQHHFTHPDNIHVHPSKRPLSPGTSVPSPAPSFSPTQTHGLTQKPTLPGIASILAFASRQPAENNSSPYFRVSFPQSSDPVAHALPISVHVAGPSSSSITSTASTRNLSARDRKISAGETANNRHFTRRRRSSSTTIIDSDSYSSLSSQSKTKSNNIGHLVHHPSSFTSTAQAAHRDQNIIEGNSAHSYSKISKTSPAPPLLA
ncbi:expressed protein [Phakopsora pachyrhizi]|uniref:Expressed protein n=1 Tax=Phakopsora pachyrhizi TaxID=170000 RepID=A0AAV0BBW1_PHAPC|nr:expressed protein [Phakopsora pachyrhizi]CAH7683296.1 expressed protein [Phakopsora pachyrhizi]